MIKKISDTVLGSMVYIFTLSNISAILLLPDVLGVKSPNGYTELTDEALALGKHLEPLELEV